MAPCLCFMHARGSHLIFASAVSSSECSHVHAFPRKQRAHSPLPDLTPEPAARRISASGVTGVGDRILASNPLRLHLTDSIKIEKQVGEMTQHMHLKYASCNATNHHCGVRDWARRLAHCILIHNYIDY
ncbi:hypothetical protein P153DRAFT_220552 [Dothidotthia symphoricarpi CBS 119687]|uniref:Uncharacterized protein n=1 Tax=Dothidotthia symphoricarpi CBS 119687 TaxID=1392245 RepID=A0A6A6AHI1_9PLEO|nr:uncharacterized protein P153DRAFT_220552 [Dothidotthia symphoricarpi CBS 119687]KAF2130555.1 hypothetical protein P153DRAFT_220552 [Dothidotthia symphoricarpi CBS 119687]